MRLTSLILALFFCWANSFSQVQQIAVNSAPAPEGYDLEIEVVNEDIGLACGCLWSNGSHRLQLYTAVRDHEQRDRLYVFRFWRCSEPHFVNTTTNYYHAAFGSCDSQRHQLVACSLFTQTCHMTAG